MQSGITASQELFVKFKELQTDSSLFGLFVTITDEQLTPTILLPRTSPTFTANLPTLAPHLTDTEAVYIILKRYDDAPHFLAVTFVPDLAKVRQKTLIASTRLTLTRELGAEHFRDSLFANTKEELTESGFKKHESHAALEAPLTEEEESLAAVKRAEQEASRGTGMKEIHLGKSLDMAIDPEALEALKKVGSDSSNLAILKINTISETVQLDPVTNTASPASVASVVKDISTSEPRFTFYRFHHAYNGAAHTPMLFFYTCPVSSGPSGAKSIKARMIYPLMKRKVLEVATSKAGIQVDKKFEVDDPSEITESSVKAELHPKAEVKTTFKRPTRPGRR